jgi:hypothetical protein
LQCGGGGDIDVGHQYPQQGNHPDVILNRSCSGRSSRSYR